MTESVRLPPTELYRTLWGRCDACTLLAEVERLRGEVARQAEQITAVQALADDWRDFGDVTIHMDDAAADIDAALEPTS